MRTSDYDVCAAAGCPAGDLLWNWDSDSSRELFVSALAGFTGAVGRAVL